MLLLQGTRHELLNLPPPQPTHMFAQPQAEPPHANTHNVLALQPMT